MKDPSRAHSPRPNRNINIILTTTYVESTAVSALALLIIWSFSISIAVRLQETQSHVLIIANWKRALDKVFFSHYPHLSFISLIHNPLILRSVFFSRALYNLPHLYYPLYHVRNVFICFQRGRGVKVQIWPHIILKNNARHRIKTIY